MYGLMEVLDREIGTVFDTSSAYITYLARTEFARPQTGEPGTEHPGQYWGTQEIYLVRG